MLDTAFTIVPLGDARSAPIDVVGGKAGRLSILAHRGLSVPDGFILGAGVYADAVAASDGGPLHLPDPLRAQFRARCDQLGYPLVVRSSAVAEDDATASFAGQFTSVLHVRSSAEAIAAVERCWLAGSDEAVEDYRRAHGVTDRALAILVQRQLDADVAGVAFGRDPVSGRDEIVVEAVPGLADRLLDGSARPERWRVDRDAASIDALRETGPVLAEADVLRIADLVRLLGDVFDGPQDVEWVLSGGALHVVQSRPITTPTGRPSAPPEVPDGWVRDSTHWPDRISPLGAAVWGWAIPEGIREASARYGFLIGAASVHVIDHRAYLELLPFVGSRRLPPPPPWLLGLLARAVPSLRRRIAHSVEAIETDVAGRELERWITRDRARLEADLAARRAVDLTSLDAAALVDRLDDQIGFLGACLVRHYVLQFGLALVVRRYVVLAHDLLGWDDMTALAALDLSSPASAEGSVELDRIADLMAAERASLAESEWLAARADLADGRSLLDGPGPAAAAFRAYLDRFGARSLGTDPIEPNLGEMPQELRQTIEAAALRRNAAGGEDETRTAPPRLPPRLPPRPPRDDEPAPRCPAHASSAAVPVEARTEWLEAIRRVERYYPIRDENRLLALQDVLGLIRRVALELGRRLTESGRLDRADDVFMLVPAELRETAALDEPADGKSAIRHLATDRRREFARAALLPDRPEIGELAPQPDLSALPAHARFANEALMWYFGQVSGAPRPVADGDVVLVGAPASPGRYRGPVRLVHSAADFGRVREGDVLVCPTTTPAWSPIIARAGAIVADHGGFLAHPAVIAREYGIPAIVGTDVGTSTLREGEVVVVDAVAGTVSR